MDNRSFGALFGPYLPSGRLSQAILDGVVESMDMDHSTRCMEVTVRFSQLISPDEIQQVESELAQALRISAVAVHPLYQPDLFTAEACASLIPYLKKENVAVNGTFEDARFVLDEDVLEVYLSHGGLNILQTTGAERQLQQLIRRQYNRAVSIHFIGEEETTKDERYQ